MAWERRALERRARAELDMERDAEEQPETRWPYISRRGRVRLCGQLPSLCWLPSHSTAWQRRRSSFARVFASEDYYCSTESMTCSSKSGLPVHKQFS